MSASCEGKQFVYWLYNAETISEGTWTYTSDIIVTASWSK